MQALLSQLAKEAGFKCTPAEARANKLCINCGEKVTDDTGHFREDLFRTRAGQQEWFISCMCEKCFDALFAEEPQ